jgi:hypothetical protein
MVAGWNPLFFFKHRFHILHFPNSTGVFTKPTGRHYIEYRFSRDIALIHGFQIVEFYVQEEPAVSCIWIGWIWEIIG